MKKTGDRVVRSLRPEIELELGVHGKVIRHPSTIMISDGSANRLHRGLLEKKMSRRGDAGKEHKRRNWLRDVDVYEAAHDKSGHRVL